MYQKIQKGILTVLLAVVLLVGGMWGYTCEIIETEAAEVNSRTSNQDKVFAYLTSTLGLNPAAASGIMANIQKESGFNPQASGSGGKYYGICQWGNARKSALITHCASKGMDYTTLEGQLEYLRHELVNSYDSIYSYLKGIPNTAQGAYDAGYYWCYHYERPGNIEATSASRGALARDQYWPMYSSYQTLPFVSYIDSPMSSQSYSQMVTIRGWALYGDGITKVVANVNGNVLNCDFQNRQDVLAAYPQYKEDMAGYGAVIPSAFLKEGANEVRLFAYSGQQEFVIGTVTFQCTNIDRTAPVISQVTVRDVTEYGYTVSCKVQDGLGLSKVQFPTWTDANGQDDLVSDWQTSPKCSGTIQGDNVTYRVSIGQHNYESGRYTTHIYAYDLVGNRSMYQIQCHVPEGAVAYGDVNSDGKINAADALDVLRHVVGLYSFNEEEQKKADVNRDVQVDAVDALLVLKYTVKLVEELPVQ